MRADTHYFINTTAGLVYALQFKTTVAIAAGVMMAAMAIAPNIIGRHQYPQDGMKFAEHPDDNGEPMPGTLLVGGTSVFGYRTVTHWWLPYVALLMLSMPFGNLWGHLAFGIAVGGLLHIAADLFDEPGVPLLTPYGARIYIGGPALEEVSDRVQKVVTVGCLAICALAIYQWVSLENALRLVYAIAALPWEVVADARWLANLVFGKYGTSAS